jgi:hypothetical protein
MTASVGLDIIAFSVVQWILLVGFLIPVVVLWGYALVSLLRRPDLGIGAKLLWLLAILVVPILGSVTYFMLRPTPQEQVRRAEARER